MSKTAVADSTCLIGLSKIGELEILRHLFGAILIPPWTDCGNPGFIICKQPERKTADIHWRFYFS